MVVPRREQVVGGGWRVIPVVAVTSFFCLGGLSGCEKDDGSGAIEVSRAFLEAGESPGQVSYPRCLDADESSLWVIDKLARVQRIDAKTGENLGGFRMPDWKLGKPIGVTTWTPAGRGDSTYLFVPDTHYHRVMVYAVPREARSVGPGEKFERLVASFGEFGHAGEGGGAGKFVFPTDVAVVPTADGRAVHRLYVGEYGGDDRISVYERRGVGGEDDSAGGEYAFVFSFGKFGSSASAEGIEFSRPQSIAYDAKRQILVVTDSCNHRIGTFRLDGSLIKWIGSPENVGDGAGQFNTPYGLVMLEDGTCLVSEFANCRVQWVDVQTGRSLGVFGYAGRGEGQLASPWGMARVGEMGFVLDSGNNRVLGFEMSWMREVSRRQVAEWRREEERAVGKAGRTQARTPVPRDGVVKAESQALPPAPSLGEGEQDGGES